METENGSIPAVTATKVSRAWTCRAAFSLKTVSNAYATWCFVLKQGCFINGQKEGLGKYVGSQGLEYDGEWKNDKYHGRGHWKHPNGDSYIGCFVEHKRDGLGTYTFADGSVYDGPSKNGSRHGKGSLKEPNGNLYEVEYVNGVRRMKRAL